jgi:hypothetical protein
MQADLYETTPTAVSGGSNPTNVSTHSTITSATTITQQVTKNDGNITLNCSTFKMNGDITAANFKTDGSVKFKVNNTYYEPVIRLGTTNSPNCF